MKYQIAVTQTLIDQGKPCTAQHCAVAKAIQVATGFNCDVMPDRVHFYPRGSITAVHEVPLPIEVTRFINAFDRAKCAIARPDPIDFELELPDGMMFHKAE